MSELLKLEDIYFQYEDYYIALNDVSVSFKAGERVAVLGSNGAGKSTFFLCCNGVLRPQKGLISLNGQIITDKKKDIYALRESVGLVFQEPDSQIIAGNVEAEISFGPMNLGLSHEEVSKRTQKAVSQMNLEGYEERAPQYLSGGEKKRVSIADILAMKPKMILLDEPTASLDPQNVVILEETLNLLSDAGITLVVSTHDVDFAYQFAKRAIVFSQGQIIADEEISKVFADDKILKKAGLKKPIIYEVQEQLKKRFKKLDDRKIKSLEELKSYIANIDI